VNGIDQYGLCMNGPPNCRTGSGSDLAVWIHSTKGTLELGIVSKAQDQYEPKRSLSLSQRPGRYTTAARLAQAPGTAVAKIKADLNHGSQSDLATALDFEAVNQDACFHSPDFIEGVTAFVQKRKAVFGKTA